ncbi:MAG: hypothetical protein BWZ02_02767 [Lentisphaerae bacterium ADurb.BinA184]|nr:MAG: hypothetical protein BWZ02_02767 [Lentisphaerae bacterium ADurb.BinA184]
MRIRIHPETTEGKPIPGDGTVLAAGTPSGLVELMRLETPFSAELTTAGYRDEVLLCVEGPGHRPLPEDPASADIEFLTRLAQNARIEFLPDGVLPEEATPDPTPEVTPCAGK